MSSKEEAVPEEVIELVSDREGALEPTFQMLPDNDPEAGEGFAVMTEKEFRGIHAPHGELTAGEPIPTVHHGLLCTCKLVCPCGTVLVSGDHRFHSSSLP